MTSAPSGLSGETAEKGGAPHAWWRRRGWLIVLVVLAIVAVTVLTDLPGSDSKAAQYSGDSGVISALNSSLASCDYAVQESFLIHRRQLGGTLTSSERAQVPGLLGQDQEACSYTSQDIYDLSDIEVPGSSSGKYLESAVGTVTTWATSDALGAIVEIERLYGKPGDATAKRTLARDQRRMYSSRAVVLGDIAKADRVLGRRLPKLHLTEEPR